MKLKTPKVLGFKFFDESPALQRAVDKKTGLTLSRVGAYARGVMRNLVGRKGGKKRQASRPGEPPRRHRGDIREKTWFYYDQRTESVVVGPLGYKTSSGIILLTKADTGVQLLNEGGKFRIINQTVKPLQQLRDSRGRFTGAVLSEAKEVSPVATLAARPFVQRVMPLAVERLLKLTKSTPLK